jgi:hypothetical protein
VEKIFSKFQSGLLLHIIYRRNSNAGRSQLVDSNEYLQVSTLNLLEGENVPAHKHLWKEPQNKLNIAQESWVIIEGRVEVTYYDVDNSILRIEILSAGDLSITLYGGHSYLILEDLIAYEFKTGPYMGPTLDRELI